MEPGVTVATFCSLSVLKRKAGGLYLTVKQESGEGRRQKGHGNAGWKQRKKVCEGQLRVPAVQPGWSAAYESPGKGDKELSQNCFPCPKPVFVKIWQDRTGASTQIVVAYWLGELPIPQAYTLLPADNKTKQRPRSYFSSPPGRTEGY